jgi:hypothetical protein
MEIGQTGLGIDYDLDSIPEVYFARRVGNYFKAASNFGICLDKLPDKSHIGQ